MLQNLVETKEKEYRFTFLLSLLAAELLVLMLVNFWPTDKTVKEIIFEHNEYAVTFENIEITKHEQRAAPPRPIVPILVPNDEVIEEEIVLEELDENLFDIPPMEMGSAKPVIANNPQRPPRVIKIVEPTYPPEAKTAKVKVEIRVTFLVDVNGNVEEAFVNEVRKLSSDNKTFEIVQGVGFGIVEATLQAAYRWRFLPAMNDGDRVKSYTSHVFTFGM